VIFDWETAATSWLWRTAKQVFKSKIDNQHSTTIQQSKIKRSSIAIIQPTS
jgi:hypothetical protein